MSMELAQSKRSRSWMIATLLVLIAAGATAAAAPPAATARVPAPPAKQTLAVLAVNLNLARANAVVPGDTELGTVATKRLRDALASQGAYDLIAPVRVDSAMSARGMPCTSDVCAIEIAKALGADAVLAVSLAKIATPVWYADTRLLDVHTGRLVRADEFELKGVPQQMIPMGMVSIARRVSQVATAQP
ncbi:MAG TPA: DUF2380 domain-containing protein [Gemmatimonadaceae bacterium]|nr:DUF2380 domain-containing protein [Gemmatimonadaceae bacterium]